MSNAPSAPRPNSLPAGLMPWPTSRRQGQAGATGRATPTARPSARQTPAATPAMLAESYTDTVSLSSQAAQASAQPSGQRFEVMLGDAVIEEGSSPSNRENIIADVNRRLEDIGASNILEAFGVSGGRETVQSPAWRRFCIWIDARQDLQPPMTSLNVARYLVELAELSRTSEGAALPRYEGNFSFDSLRNWLTSHAEVRMINTATATATAAYAFNRAAQVTPQQFFNSMLNIVRPHIPSGVTGTFTIAVNSRAENGANVVQVNIDPNSAHLTSNGHAYILPEPIRNLIRDQIIVEVFQAYPAQGINGIHSIVIN